MPRRVPADLEDALAAAPAARERFWSLPPEQVDAWVAWVERARLPGARRRRIAVTVRRLGGGEAAVVATPADAWPLWALGLALLAALAAFLVWLVVYRQHTRAARPATVVVAAKSTVPRVVGIRVQAAQFQLRQAKLASTTVVRPSRKPKGIVIGQAPQAGARVPQGTKATLLVSAGPPAATLPDVTGLAAADAAKELRSLKLLPVLKQVSSHQPPGTVVAQSPRAGARAKRGSTVVLTVAKGAVSVPVPTVTGQTAQQAATTLAHAGFEAHAVQVPSSQPAGTVVAQSPAGGSKARRGSSVRLNVSRAQQAATTTAATTTQPATTQQQPSGNDYRGMRLPAAVQRIVSGRQQVVVVYVKANAPEGVVVANSAAGSRERLEVSAGPHPQSPADVPDVTGEDASQASSDLRAAGFGVVEAQWPVSDQSQDGVVTYETPDGHLSAPRGGTVVVYIGSSA